MIKRFKAGISKDKTEQFIKELFISLGEDVRREGLKDTPTRVTKVFQSIFRGYLEAAPRVTVFEKVENRNKRDQIILDEGYFYSMCEHHLMTFFGRYWFAYIPDKKIIGLSKISRIVSHYAAKLQTQENLTREIIDSLEETLEPKGIALILKARHLCKEARGIGQYEGYMTTSEIRGWLEKKPAMKFEFLRLIGEKIRK